MLLNLNFFSVYDRGNSSAGINEWSIIKKLFGYYFRRSAWENALNGHHNGIVEKNNQGKSVNNLSIDIFVFI